jgi:hypothetical protein
MGEAMPENSSQGITRRDLLKRGAALGGAVVWVTPVVQTVGMGRAFATTASPAPCTPGISYIAMNVTCGGVDYFIKWEAPGSWEIDPGTAPGCEASFTPTGQKISGATLGFSVSVDANGFATVSIPVSCTVNKVAVKGSQNCDVFNGPIPDGQTFQCPQTPSVGD